MLQQYKKIIELFMADYGAFMNLEYAEKRRKGMSEAKWVWTEMAYLWVNGANKNNKVF